MLSYQHIYHAGCLADVHKHLLLVRMLEAMVESPEPITYMETHAGRGLYDLSSPEARKTGEAKEGILKWLREKRLPPEDSYFRLLEKVKAMHGRNAYPGSPLLAQLCLRDRDRLYLHELHPREYTALEKLTNPRTFVKKENGYIGSMRLSLPKNRRGLVLIDPSYEIKSEYEQAAYFVQDMHEKWPEAVILLWYPLLNNRLFADMADYLGQCRLPGYMRHEVRFADPEKTRGMFGSGMIGVNVPADKKAWDAVTALFAE